MSDKITLDNLNIENIIESIKNNDETDIIPTFTNEMADKINSEYMKMVRDMEKYNLKNKNKDT